MFGSPPTRLPLLREEPLYACVGCVHSELGGVLGDGWGNSYLEYRDIKMFILMWSSC